MLGLSLRLGLVLVLLLFSIFASSLLMTNALVVGLSACRPAQIQALMKFKSEFDSSGCNQSDYVNGVECNNATGVVTKLQLPKGCLSGILKPNSSLFSLHHLRYLNLADNDFTSSSIPSGFGNLNRLEVLSLSSNGFQGQVPSSFSNLSLLFKLDLSHNKLTGSFPLVRNLTKLSLLDFSYNQFSGTIPSSLFTMRFLSYLNLEENHLTDSIQLHSSSSSSRLQKLVLGHNLFEGQILEPISKLINLTDLDLSSLNITYPIDLSFFSSLKSLVYLDLSGNRISPSSVNSDSILPLSIETLLLSGCNVSAFPTILKLLQNLQFISMSSNRVEGKIPRWLWSLPGLTLVDLRDNFLNGFQGSAEALVNSSVKFLDLESNDFEGPLPNLPLSINILSARGNRFTGNIPLSICNCRSLTHLMIPENYLTGPIPECLSNLMVLHLRFNHMEGSIPDMFHAGASLRTLDVGYNLLTGKLPRSLLNCSSLKFLSVDNNRFKDTFPFWLKALPNLQVLTLRSNKFYGPISPPNKGPLAFPELRILEISNNNFTGRLPQSYFVKWKTSAPKMNEDGRIYMGYNQTGQVVSFVYFDSLDLQYKGLSMKQSMLITSYSTIDFSGNKLEGEIPESIGLLKPLIALNLSNNAFTGHIPLSLANLTELESLDMSRNQLSGSIPNGLRSLSFLVYINVSHNQLKGEIPQGPQITGQAKSSFEGNAGLCGLPLQESCFGSNAPPTQQLKEEDDDKEEEEEVLKWKAVAIAYGPGVLVGLAIAQLIASYKPEWLVKIIGPEKRRIR